MKSLTSALVLSLLLFLPTMHLSAQNAPASVIPAPRDGAAFDRYEMLNERVQAHQGELDILFVGDSITEGWEGAGRQAWESYYGDRRAVNIGIGGDQTQHVLWRLENGNIDGLNPAVTVLMIGTNNSGPGRSATGEILDGVQAVVASLQEKLPETKILLLGIFPRSRHFDEQRGQVLQVNQALRNLHNGEDVFFLDFGHRFLDADGTIPEAIMPDALHLSPEGYQIWAEAMEPTLIELLKK